MKKMTIKPESKELMENLIKSLENTEVVNELTEKYNNTDMATQMKIYKETEDSILVKLSTSPTYYLKAMKTNFKYRYYDKEMMVKVIDLVLASKKKK